MPNYDPIISSKLAACPSCGSEAIEWKNDHFECSECKLGRNAEYNLWSSDRWNRFCKEFIKPQKHRSTKVTQTRPSGHVDEISVWV